MKKRVISMILAFCMLVSVASAGATAFAAGPVQDSGIIVLGTSGIGKGDSIYFGKYEQDNSKEGMEPIQWRVLDTLTNTGTEGLFLLSEKLLGSDPVRFSHSSRFNAWQNSYAREWCENLYTNNFSDVEKGAVKETSKNDGEFTSSTNQKTFAMSDNILNNDKVFFLSAQEVESGKYGFDKDSARIANHEDKAKDREWWLRSPSVENEHIVGKVLYNGQVGISFITADLRARPAFNLNSESVLFTSAAVGGKSSNSFSLQKVRESTDSGKKSWKVTLLDKSRNFSISDAKSEGGTITFSYSQAQTGTNEYISAVITDNGKITHYGRILHLDGTSHNTSGTARLSLPENAAFNENTKLYVFNEQYNGGTNDDTKLTDYASAFQIVDLTVDNIEPTLVAGSATRTSATEATVKFTSSEAGTYYYAVMEKGSTAPTDLMTNGTGGICVDGENTISLTTLSADAKDIYIVVKDAAGNVSKEIRIEIPAYVAPTYGISVEPDTLSFGDVTIGYSAAPTAKPVTIKNTGNQTVTVNLPASTAKYAVTAGTGFSSGKATIATGNTAEFSVQPATGLAEGTHSETLTVSGDHSVSATVSLSFKVNGTAFVPVKSITGVPATAATGTDLTLTGTVVPSNATNKTIVWSVKNAGTTGATISGDTLTTTAAGTVKVTATITNGKSEREDYTQDFTINIPAPTTANYTVKHMQEKLDALGTYEEVTADTQTLNGNVGENTAAAAKAYPGFVSQTITQKEIAEDGSTVVEIKYDRKHLIIKLDANGGEGSMEDLVFVFDELKNLPANTFVKEGYTFKVWNFAADGSGPQDFADEAGMTFTSGNLPDNYTLTLYAQWEEDTPSHTHTATLVTGQAATCTADGWKDYYKCDCGKFFEDAACTTEISNLDAWKTGAGKLAKLEHTLGEWQHDDVNHWKKCSVCGNDVEKAAHTMKEVIDKAATETATGLKHSECTICGYKTASVTIPVIPPTITCAMVTFKIVNGTWDGKDSKDKAVTVTLTDGKGTLNSADVPTGMKPDSGYTGGAWNKTPATEVTGDVTYTYTFEKKSSGGGGGGSCIAPTYSITIEETKNGTVTCSDKQASRNETITLTVKPDEGYQLSALTVTDSKGKEIRLTEKYGRFTFQMPASGVWVEASFQKEVFFVDVPTDAYYADAVSWAVRNGITAGVGGAAFAPDASCTRAQIVTFLWRAAGMPEPVSSKLPFVDVDENSYFAKAVLWAVENGITSGTSATTFSPDATCTRAQAVTFLHRSENAPALGIVPFFADVAPDAYYADAVSWAAYNGITSGTGDNIFSPDANCTRAQIVTFLYRALNK